MPWLVLALGCTSKAHDTGGPADSDDAPHDPLGGAVLPFPDCEPGPSDGRLDLERGCADGVCLGQTLAQADAAYGQPGTCLPLGQGRVTCFYGDGVLAGFLDADADGAPDDGARASLVQVLDPWDGGTAEGLSLAISVGCWVAQLGAPDAASLTRGDDGYHATVLTWDAWDLRVVDLQDQDLAFSPDGLVEAAVFNDPIYDL